MAKPCTFNSTTKTFSGTPLEQASCLLRRVRIVGNIDNAPAQLPQALATRIGAAVDYTVDQLTAFLNVRGIAASDIGGPLTGGLSKTIDGKEALYFVIHDTSDELPGAAFPDSINTASWSLNTLANRDVSRAHVFINRIGQSRTGHDYSRRLPKPSIKFESPASKDLKGRFLHHELVQPRIKGGFKFHAVAPAPGFPAAQYERLALCYIAAARRAGKWLIPAYHCVLDQGIPDGHDDPQNFDLFAWAAQVERLHQEVKAPQPAVGDMGMAASLEAVVPVASAPQLEDHATFSDGHRNVTVRRIRGTKPLFFRAKLSIDADGAARAYHPKDDPEALDLLKHSTVHSRKFIQGKKKNGVIGIGPRPGFFVSGTALQKGEDHNANAYVDAEFIPYIVLPNNFAPDVARGSMCIVVNLNNDRVTPAIFADTNPNVGEVSVRAAINLRVHDASFPITELAKKGGDTKADYVYVVFPGSTLAAAATAPHWPADEIAAKADALFAAWGGLAMVRKIFG